MFKTCSVCQRSFETETDWVSNTFPLAVRESNLFPGITEIWRNCRCGSTQLHLLPMDPAPQIL